MAMSNGNSEAEQIVHIAFQGVALALRLSGDGVKNLSQLIYNASKDEKNLNKRSGEARKVEQLLRENKPLQTYKLDIDDIKRFRKLAKQYGVLYTMVKDIKSEDGLCTIILKQEELPMLNNILADMGLRSAYPITKQDDKKKDVLSKDALGILRNSIGP